MDIKNEWSQVDRLYLAVFDLVSAGDGQARRLYKKHFPNTLIAYCEFIAKNPNQTQIAQRIYAHAMAERLEGK